MTVHDGKALRRMEVTMSRVTIVGLGGSLAKHSSSLSALSVALEGAREHGADVRLFDLRELNLPVFVPDADPTPAAARELCDAVFAARGLLWSSPLYHGTVSGSFKNALDWLQLLSDRNPPYLTDKVVGLISAARTACRPSTRWNLSCGLFEDGPFHSCYRSHRHGRRSRVAGCSTNASRNSSGRSVVNSLARLKCLRPARSRQLRRAKWRLRSNHCVDSCRDSSGDKAPKLQIMVVARDRKSLQ